MVNEIDEAKTLNFNFSDQPISWVKYICNNTIFTKHVALAKMMDFVNGMLWFRSVDNNSFIGFKSNPEALNKIIIDNDNLSLKVYCFLIIKIRKLYQ